MKLAEQQYQEKHSALQGQLRLKTREVEELRAENTKKDEEMMQLKFNDSLGRGSAAKLL